MVDYIKVGMQCRHIYNITNISTLITTNVILNQSIVLYCIAMAMAEQHHNIKQKLPLLKLRGLKMKRKENIPHLY